MKIEMSKENELFINIHKQNMTMKEIMKLMYQIYGQENIQTELLKLMSASKAGVKNVR